MKQLIAVYIALFFYSDIEAQWSAEVFYVRKNIVPSEGFGISVERNLPVQLPELGFSSKSSFTFFNEKTSAGNKYHSFDLNTSIAAAFYFRTVRPYLGLGLGLQNFTFKPVSGSGYESFNKLFFSLISFVGIRFHFSPLIQPFGEIKISRLIPSQQKIIPDKYQNIQLKISAGLRINLDLL